MNLLDALTPQTLSSSPLRWTHPPLRWEPLSGRGLRVQVGPKTDYFRSPDGTQTPDNAPYLWLEVMGDFVAQAHVRPVHASHYDAAALMARHDALHWAKLCYEATDFGTRAIVSVVTNEYSDDANGVNLVAPDVWLQLFRAGDVFGMHYALDGKGWQMVRLFRLVVPPTIQVGLVAQCPTGPGTTVDFLSFTVDSRTITDLRAGV